MTVDAAAAGMRRTVLLILINVGARLHRQSYRRSTLLWPRLTMMLRATFHTLAARRLPGRLRSLAFGACLLAVSGCTTTTYAHRAGDHRVGSALEQPLRDVSWMRENPPEVLLRAAETPYALEDGGECSAILEEIAALDLVLGPDVDAPDEHQDESSTDARGLLSGAIGGVVGLPYRSIVRRISGADRRERELRESILAGMVRRAFLKGVARGCSPDAPPTSPAEAPTANASLSQE